MAFWSDNTMKEKGIELISPYRGERVRHGAYELSIGSEAYITSEGGKKSKVASDTPITIPPGQFGLLITREVVSVPKNAIALISIRAGTKFRGLVNVSGFHVDPGYNDKLMFSVYNAGSQEIVLDYDQAVFLIWYADLDRVTDDPYPERKGEPRSISADDMMKIQGEVASPAELKTQLEDLKQELQNQVVELKSEISTKFHTVEQSRLMNRWLLTVLLTALLSIGVTLYIRALFDSGKEGKGNIPAPIQVPPLEPENRMNGQGKGDPKARP